jgi:hypothetical protein
MSDDRWSKDQKEIDEAGAKAEPPPRTCGAQSDDGDVCELFPCHIGNHRRKLADGTFRYWWDVVSPEDIERAMKKFEPEPTKKQPVQVSVKPEKDDG